MNHTHPCLLPIDKSDMCGAMIMVHEEGGRCIFIYQPTTVDGKWAVITHERVALLDTEAMPDYPYRRVGRG
jgi:hypothetical protein